MFYTIQAITTGTIPNFIDVAFNFGSKPVSGDSVLLQATQAGYKSIFYGDDTWLTLFPSIFERYDGTTSFVVTDFTEVLCATMFLSSSHVTFSIYVQ